MAISQVQSLLHLLLASLFFLPTLHAIDFEYCNQKGYKFGNITGVVLSPNPAKYGVKPTVTVSGLASSEGIEFGIVEVSMINKDGSHMIEDYTLCYLDACPIQPRTKFVLEIDDFPVDFENHNEIKYGVSLFFHETENFCIKFGIPISNVTLDSV